MNNDNLSKKDLVDKLKLIDQLLINKSHEVETLKRIILSNISHEIRTPLNAIMGFSTLLIEEETNLTDREIFLEGIYSSSERLLKTVTNILEAAKIQSEEIKIKDDEIILEDLLEELKIYFDKEKEKEEKHNVKLKIKNDLNKKKVKVKTDPVILKKILTNLIDNALKFTEEGFIAFGYTLKNKSVQFHIIDTGVGIPKDKSKHIFSNFEQIEDSLVRKFGGLGMGLSISNQLTKLLGGKISLESEPDIGSFFTIDIPVKNIQYQDDEIFDEYLKNTNFTWPEETFYQLKNKSIENKHLYSNLNNRINVNY